MKAVVVGLGQFGVAAAVAFERAGVETIAIDRKMGPVESVKDAVDHAVCMDAAASGSLESQGVQDADVLLAGIGEDFEAQILVIVQARKLGVKRIVARATTEVHSRVLEAVGADLVINPEREAAQDTVMRLLAPGGEGLRVANGLAVIEIPTPGGMVGRTLRDQGADLREQRGIHLLAARPTGEEGDGELTLSPDHRIAEGDRLYVAGSPTDLASVV